MNHQHQLQGQQPAQASSKASGEQQEAKRTSRKAAVKYLSDDADAIIAKALSILEQRLRRPGQMLTTPGVVKDFLRLRLSGLDHEQFHVLFLDVKNRLLAVETMFTGTLTHTSVYPREVVKAALRHNASGLMFAHNHPSGACEPSEADLRLTTTLVQALTLVDVRVLDHFVIAGVDAHSFAEHGQL